MFAQNGDKETGEQEDMFFFEREGLRKRRKTRKKAREEEKNNGPVAFRRNVVATLSSVALRSDPFTVPETIQQRGLTSGLPEPYDVASRQ